MSRWMCRHVIALLSGGVTGREPSAAGRIDQEPGLGTPTHHTGMLRCGVACGSMTGEPV